MARASAATPAREAKGCDARPVTPDEFLARCPRLWHVAPAGAWEQISEHGFLTASQLIERSDLDPAAKRVLSEEPRREHVTLPVFGGRAVLRDQGPLFARKDLTTILGDGLTTADWIHLLNRRIYLFASQAPLRKVLDKYVAQNGGQDVIEISPAALLEVAADRIELAAQNTGAIARKKGPQKGLDTFVPLHTFPNVRPHEVTVVGGIPSTAAVISVERHRRSGQVALVHPAP